MTAYPSILYNGRVKFMSGRFLAGTYVLACPVQVFHHVVLYVPSDPKQRWDQQQGILPLAVSWYEYAYR